jgi:hypothetical protein
MVVVAVHRDSAMMAAKAAGVMAMIPMRIATPASAPGD